MFDAVERLSNEAAPSEIQDETFGFDADERRAVEAAIAGAAQPVEQLVWTAFPHSSINAKGGAEGRQITGSWLEWCSRRAKAAAEPWQLPHIADNDRRKTSQPYEVGAALTHNKRALDNVEAATWFCLDFDGKAEPAPTLDDGTRLAEVLRALGLAHYVGESSSSSRSKRKLHVYIQTVPALLVGVDGRPMTPEQRRSWAASIWKPAYHLVVETLRRLARVGAAIDPAVAEVARALFVARIPPGAESRWHTFAPGKGLDVVEAARKLAHLGLDVPASALKSPSKPAAAGRQRFLTDTSDIAGEEREGGFICSHSHGLSARDFLSWARKSGRADELLPERNGAARSSIPLGVQVYRVAKATGLLGPRLGPRSYLCLCPRRDEHGDSCPQKRGDFHSSTVIFLPDDVADVEAYVDPPEVEVADHARPVAETALELSLRALRDRLSLQLNGDAESTVDNVIIILQHDPRWAGVLAWNEMSNSVEKLSPPPWPAHARGAGEQTGAWNDKDDVRLRAWLDTVWGITMSASDARQAVEVAAEASRSFHAVRDYLSGLPAWDKTSRVDSWLVDLLGASDSPYARKVGRWWLISAVARAVTPGCKVDTMLVLEGPQGIFKSQAMALLAAGPTRRVFSDTPIDFGTKDRFEQIKGVWIYEVAELAGLDRHDAATLKAFVSSPSDNYRRPYGRGAVQTQRCCVFVGTVNPESGRGYLRDTTGNRRFWPVAVRSIDREAIAARRDQIWAEALHLFRAGERWWPEGEAENKICADAAAERTSSGDAWTELIAQKLAEVYEDDVRAGLAQYEIASADADEALNINDFVGPPATKITARVVLSEWLNLTASQQSRDASLRVSKIMSELGLTTKQKRVAGESVKQFSFENDATRRWLLARVLMLSQANDGGDNRRHLQSLREFAMSPRFPSRVRDGKVERAVEYLRGVDADFAAAIEGLVVQPLKP